MINKSAILANANTARKQGFICCCNRTIPDSSTDDPGPIVVNPPKETANDAKVAKVAKVAEVKVDAAKPAAAAAARPNFFAFTTPASFSR